MEGLEWRQLTWEVWAKIPGWGLFSDAAFSPSVKTKHHIRTSEDGCGGWGAGGGDSVMGPLFFPPHGHIEYISSL